jgi:hypothetical protein
MWTRTGTTISSALAGVTLHTVMSDSGEGVAFDVLFRATVLGRVQEYTATIEAGKGLTSHGATWAFTPTTGGGGRWAKTAGQTIFGFRNRNDAVRHAVNARRS